ncbi:E3 ubiquitin-protein ligase ubr2 [Phtheirospermum japonicum]|uniref:E3 ubiquitin-protein ligase n=1 Tax=Phtheirospermum japonicum TaxID=374723 RepID=A0A830C1X5_9LAMI|nr:E3 ubiquitin-protein ligase ubr2 [Phtheirospermum japonicum]
MEVDSSPESHYDLIIQRLLRLGIPRDKLNQGQYGLVACAKSNRFNIEELVSAILPTDGEDVDEDVFNESMTWLQWLMFEGDPVEALENLAKLCANQQGVCGAVWGNNDIAYRCRTCEHDPTCAICVPCFENGNHKDHDYSVIYTGGGCCDCGDITAWKREGFCSKHKGAEQIQPLPKHFAEPLGPVLDLLLNYWKEKLLSAKIVSEESSRIDGRAEELQRVAEALTSTVVDILLDFGKHSESLLSFISQRVYSSPGLLDILLRAERFVGNGGIVGKLHELLLKMLSEPLFKYEFSKAFVMYYPAIVDGAINEGSDAAYKRYPLLSTFSVQILTVSALTVRLVEEMNLLGVLLQCLGNIFVYCAGEDGRLQVVKWANLYETTIRVVEDIRFVLSHSAVPKYLCHSRRDLIRTWMKLLASVQGMNTLKRETGSHIEDDNENVHLPFVLCHSISSILSLLVAGAFSVSSNDDTSEETFFSSAYNLDCEDQDSRRHAKVGRLSQESSVCSITGKGASDLGAKAGDSFPVPSLALWLIYECLKSIENWLGLDNTLGPLSALSLKTSDGSGNNFLALKRTLSRFRRARLFKSPSSSDNKPFHVGSECSQSIGQALPGVSDESIAGESTSEQDGLRVLGLSDWHDITYDVSLQEISVHIPLHRLLSMVLRRALKECFGESGVPSADHSFVKYGDFLGHILDGCHPNGFSAFVMEHPLQIRVFCAQVHAGMWRRNGDAPILFCEWYRSVRWSEQGHELDLFLLQCCAALAPPDLYVQRILERFGLSSYLSMNLEQSSEHEPVLVADMLTLIIQIVKERRFCGLTTAECLQRELVYKLSIGDATRSQLVKSLPRDLSKVDELQEVLDKVAEYSHPSGMTQGMYKLRPSYWRELDLYHPRWNLRDQQAAEERYLRFCNVSALTTQLPKWTKIYQPLGGIAKIATCKTLLQIVRAVLFYAVFTDKPDTSRAPDGVLLTALHLLALALDVCQSHKESGDPLCYVGDVIPVLAFAGEEICMNKYGEQSLLSLLVLLMRMHEKEPAQNFMEAGNFNLSSLISNIIKSFVELEPGCMNKLQKLAPQLANQFSYSIINDNAMDTDLTSDSEKRKAKARERQAAIMEKMRAQQSKFLESFNSSQDDEMADAKSEQEACESEVSDDTQESAQVICSLCHDPKSRSPVSFLVLLQKSRLLSFVNRGPPSWEQVRRSGKEHVVSDTSASSDLSPTSISDSSEIVPLSQLEDLVQGAINDFASTGQPHELIAFMEFIKARFPSIKNVQLPSMSRDTTERTSHSLETFEEHIYSLIRESQSSLSCSDSLGDKEKCSTSGSSNDESLLLVKYIASLPKEPLDSPSASQNGRSSSQRMKSESSTLRSGSDDFGPSGADGIYVSSCGHAVHQGCLDRYLSSLRERYMRRIVFEGGHIVDPDQGEFLCPVCRGLANSVLPALSGDLRKVPKAPAVSNINFTDTSGPSTSSDRGDSLYLRDAFSLLRRAADIAGSRESLKALPARNVRLKPNLEPVIGLLCGMYYPGQGKNLETGRMSHSLILWDTLKYSLVSAEIAARSRKSSLSANYSLGALYKELKNSSCFILSLLLDVVQSTRSLNSRTLLLRLRGLQLFTRSLCRGAYSKGLPSYSKGGNMLHILENAEPEVRYPDIQFWRQASEPILARDAFSSFMWILFCLPTPILSCKESYLSLVHVFYLVAVIQAIIAYHKERQITETDMGLCNSLITDILRVLGECREAVQYFESYSVNPAYDINNSVRSLTFPYLRKCALLWKLINCSNMMPFSDGLDSYTANDLEYTTNFADELPEIEKLENMFKIPSFDLIVSDEEVRSTALGWLGHFCEVLESHISQRALRCVPAVPFKLMHLPHLYQDLLQRKSQHCACCVVKCARPAGERVAGKAVVRLMQWHAALRTTILLQRSARQAPWPSPYLDAFGEEDVEMQRGKPLFLNEERYAALTHMVASHGLDRSSKVLRQTTVGSFFMF